MPGLHWLLLSVGVPAEVKDGARASLLSVNLWYREQMSLLISEYNETRILARINIISLAVAFTLRECHTNVVLLGCLRFLIPCT